MPRRRFLALVGSVLAAPGEVLAAGPSELIVADMHTGLAIAGYDPVAYFVDAAPVPGQPEFELQFETGIFRFRNQGNRAAFSAHPEVYRPQFGGYDPTALARRIALAGNPLEWMIFGDRLYFFYKQDDRVAFAANPKEAIAAAIQSWPEVARSLVQ